MVTTAAADVSIVIPFKDRLPLVVESVKAAVRQHGATVEIIVVDDGSTDDIRDVKSLVEAEGGLFVQQPHDGIASARNAGIQRASGRWITFVDSDDIVYENKFAVQLACMVEGSLWSCTGYDLLSPSGDIVGGAQLENLPPRFWRHSCPFGATSVLADRQFVLAVGSFDVNFSRSEDWDLFIRLGDASAPTIVTQRLYGYRLHCGNVSGKDPSEWVKAWHLLRRKHKIEPAYNDYPGIQYNLPQVAPDLFFSEPLAKRFERRAS